MFGDIESVKRKIMNSKSILTTSREGGHEEGHEEGRYGGRQRKGTGRGKGKEG